MNFFVRNIVLVHVAALAFAFSWIHGGTRSDLLAPVVPWLSLFALEFLLIYPQARSNETLSEARERVWRALVRDPLLYAALALTIVVVVIPLFNVAGVPVFEEAQKHWHNPVPPIPWLPSCAKANEHAVLLLWFPPVLIAALAAKHGVLKKGKRILVELLCWNGAALALLGFLQQATGAKSIYWGETPFEYFFSTFGYPNFAGAFFTLLFALSAGLWFGRAGSEAVGAYVWRDGSQTDEESFVKRHYLLVAVVLNFAGAIASLSRAAILLSLVVFVVLSVYIMLGVWQKTSTGGHVKVLAALAITVLVCGLSLTAFAPKALKKELSEITPQAVIERVSGKAYYHVRVAKEIFRDHPAFGVGGWGYSHYLMQYLKPEEIPKMQIQGGANVHNDSLQFLAEHGWVGYGLLILCLLLLVGPLVWNMALFVKSGVMGTKDTSPAVPKWLYGLPPLLVAVFVGTTATVCHSLGDLPFRSPAILVVWVLAFVCAPGFLPAVRMNEQR